MLKTNGNRDVFFSTENDLFCHFVKDDCYRGLKQIPDCSFDDVKLFERNIDDIFEHILSSHHIKKCPSV